MPFSWLLYEDAYAPQKKIFVKLSNIYPQKSYFSWLLSEEIFSRYQLNFWKNVKVFTSNCRVIMRGFFTNAHNHFFDRKNIFANVYILQSRVLWYMEEFKEKSIKLLAKPRTDIQKASFIYWGTFILCCSAPRIERRNFWFTRWKTPLAVATKWEGYS